MRRGMAMTTKRLSVLTWTLLSTAGAVIIVVFFVPVNRPGVSRANLDRVQNGMTWEQVEEILGDNHELCGKGRPWAFTKMWTGNAGQLAFVTFRCERAGGRLGELKVINTEWRGAFMANLENILDYIR